MMKRIFSHPAAAMRLMTLIIICLGIFPAAELSARPNDKVLNRPYADLKRLHLGFSVGMHFQDLTFTHNDFITPDGQQWRAEVPNFSPGFCVNVMGDLRLHNNFNLRLSPGMYFGSKTVEMIDFNSGGELHRTQDIKSAYVVVPLDLKISGMRLGNCRPYATIGAMATFDISKKRTETLLFNSADAYLTVGMGVDFYLPFFKFNPEIKFCFGLTDILRHVRPDLDDDPETFKMTQTLSKVKSNMFVVTFYFE